MRDGSTVSYIADSLNVHRRHDESVTHSLDTDSHLQEIESIHALVSRKVDPDFEIVQSMQEYIDELRVQFKEKPVKGKKAA